MAGSYSVGALAIAAERANAIGAVRLTLARDALEVELLRVGSFSTSFVPGALVEMVRFQAPYLAVRGLVEKDGALCLAFDPTVVAPFNRFTLSRFTDAPLEALVGAHRARVRWRTLATLLPVPTGIAAAWLLPETLASGWLGRLAIGVLVSLGVHYAMRELARWVTFGGPISRHYRETFERRLAGRLEIAPVVSPDLEPLDLPTEEPLAPPIVHVARHETGAVPRARMRMAFALAAVVAFLVGSIAFIKEYAAPHRFHEAVAIANAPPGATPEGADPAAREPNATGASVAELGQESDDGAAQDVADYPSCLCERADSPLWRDGLPTLSMLPSSRDRDESGRPSSDVAAKPDEEDIYRFDFDIAVVNNTDDELSDIKTVLTFARRNPQGDRAGVTDRGLFWEGALGPGRAVKWQVEAPGTEVRIDGPDTPDGSGSGLLRDDAIAPADRFFRLTSAHQRVVRLHGAMMLAYLGDPRARDAAMGLSGLSLDEESVRDAVVRASAPVNVCGVAGEGPDYSVCIFNGTSAPRRGFVVREVIETGTPREAAVAGTIPVHEGLEIPFPLGDGSPPLEVVAVERP